MSYIEPNGCGITFTSRISMTRRARVPSAPIAMKEWRSRSRRSSSSAFCRYVEIGRPVTTAIGSSESVSSAAVAIARMRAESVMKRSWSSVNERRLLWRSARSPTKRPRSSSSM